MDNNEEITASVNILHMLNEDCWRAILDLLNIHQIIQTERVSRGWQHVIHRYIQSESLSIQYPQYKELEHDRPHIRNCRILNMDKDDPGSFDKIITKWGSSIKKMDCVKDIINERKWALVRKNCPNLEDITLLGLRHNVLLYTNFIKLKRISFRSCSVTDVCVSGWLTRTTEVLEILEASVTGSFLRNLNSTNLKALRLRQCPHLELRHLLSAVDHLAGLKKLELYLFPGDIFQNVHLLLDKMPNLEDLCLVYDKEIELGSEVRESVCGLGGLRRLDLSFNPNVTDDWLDALASSRRLEELLLERCEAITPKGIRRVCLAAGPALRALHVGGSRAVCNCHVRQFIEACPNLESLDVSYCHEVSEDLVAIVGAATRGRPRFILQVENTMIEGFTVELYPWLTLDFGVFEDSCFSTTPSTSESD